MRTAKQKIGLFFIKISCVLIIFTVLFFICSNRARPIIKSRLKEQAIINATNVLNKTVMDYIQKNDLCYADICNIKRDGTGKILSIEINSRKVSSIKSQICLELSERINQIEKSKYYINIGTLSGVKALIERGFEVRFYLSCSGYAETETRSEFTSVGVNQTLHKVILKATLYIYCCFPGYYTSDEISSDFCLAETLIIGDVPNAFYSQ